MKDCISFLFPDLPVDDVESISKEYCGKGNIRLAIDAAAKTAVSLTKIKTSATSTTAESSEATPSSLSDGFGAMTMEDTSIGSDGRSNEMKAMTQASMDSREALSGLSSLADELSTCSNDAGDGTDLGDGS